MKRAALLPLLLLFPASLGAQATSGIAAYAGTGESVRDARVGAMLHSESGALGLRLGVAVDAARLRGEAATTPSSWSADLDGTARLGALFSPLEPVRIFAGLGARETESGLSPNVSAGVGYTRRLIGPLAVETELRYRKPFSNGTERIEGRIGLGLRFGRSLAPLHRPTAPAVPAVRPTRPLDAGEAAVVARRAIHAGNELIGTRYTWGGNTPKEGFDCSGFLRYIFARNGVDLPRVSRDQARFGEALPLKTSAFRPGDLLFFAADGRTVDHAALYVGEGRILHSSSSGGGVRYDDLGSARGRWYTEHMVAARRVLGASGLSLALP